MPPRFDTARFHIESGPDSLFTRVRHILREPAELKANGRHVTERVNPLELWSPSYAADLTVRPAQYSRS